MVDELLLLIFEAMVNTRNVQPFSREIQSEEHNDKEEEEHDGGYYP